MLNFAQGIPLSFSRVGPWGGLGFRQLLAQKNPASSYEGNAGLGFDANVL